ncbi:nuclear transport factor 2 family protein [Sphingomonas sp.]|uniref:nuclear transport factor 2 family protein n=1 Tax=Sphingomonas sp. TaxID=28214 RepID=UPI000DB0A140|nr:nuclear transport factor 2 family protein [Sphingomonas sp.]PZU10770.1 MAG: polyketide cyclase [Sphingomonas sp.]
MSGTRARLARLESESAVRAVMTRYMALCDDLTRAGAMDDLSVLFTAHAVWRGVGGKYAQAYGGYDGRDAIMAMFRRHIGPPAHFVFNAHFLTSEAITVAPDAQTASGHWMLIQTARYASGMCELRSARITARFAQDGEDWRIALFETENLFARPVDLWDAPESTPTPSR